MTRWVGCCAPALLRWLSPKGGGPGGALVIEGGRDEVGVGGWDRSPRAEPVGLVELDDLRPVLLPPSRSLEPWRRAALRALRAVRGGGMPARVGPRLECKLEPAELPCSSEAEVDE